MTSEHSKNSIIVILVFAFLALGLFSFIVNDHFAKNEQMYITSSVLYNHHTLYKDYMYVQMPAFPMLHGTVYKWFGIKHYLLSARVFNFLFMILASFIIWSLGRTKTKDIVFTTCLIAVWLINDPMMAVSKEAANYLPSATFALLGFYLTIRSLKSDSVDSLGVFLSGLCIGLSILFKLYYVTYLAAYYFIFLFQPGFLNIKERIVKVMLPFSLGVGLGLSPCLYFMVASFENFMYDNLDFGLDRSSDYQAHGAPSERFALSGKLRYCRKMLSAPSMCVITLALSVLFLNVLQTKERAQSFFKGFFQKEHALCVLLLIVSALTILIPSPTYIQYFALVVPYMIILIIYLYQMDVNTTKLFARSLVIAALGICVLYNGPRFFKPIKNILKPNTWTTVAVHNRAQQIRAAIPENLCNEKIATLTPAFVIEANLPIYLELAMGSFYYRVADLKTPQQRKQYVGVSPKTIISFLENDPPGSILVGYERPEYDAPLIKFAEDNQYQRIDKTFDGMSLYLRPDSFN